MNKKYDYRHISAVVTLTLVANYAIAKPCATIGGSRALTHLAVAFKPGIKDIFSSFSLSDSAWLKVATNAQAIHGSNVSASASMITVTPAMKIGDVVFPVHGTFIIDYDGDVSIGRAIQLAMVSEPPPLTSAFVCNPQENTRYEPTCCEECGASDGGWYQVSHLLNRGYTNKHMELRHTKKITRHILVI